MDKFQASFLSLNVRGLNDNKKRRKIFSWCKKQNTDIVFLQETYSTAEVENIWTNEWATKLFFHTEQIMREVLLFCLKWV